MGSPRPRAPPSALGPDPPRRLCALLNIRSEDALRHAPAAGAVWGTFVFAQLRHRERAAGRAGNLFFWRDRTREVDFVVEDAGRLRVFEAEWTELPTASDTANLAFVRNIVGEASVSSGAIVAERHRGFPWATASTRHRLPN